MRKRLFSVTVLWLVFSVISIPHDSIADKVSLQEPGESHYILKKKEADQNLLLSRLKSTQNPQEMGKLIAKLGKFIDFETDRQQKQKLIRWQKKAQYKLLIIKRRLEIRGANTAFDGSVEGTDKFGQGKRGRQSEKEHYTRLNQMGDGMTRRIRTSRDIETAEKLLINRRTLYQAYMSRLSHDIRNEQDVETKQELMRERQTINQRLHSLEKQDRELFRKMKIRNNQRIKEIQGDTSQGLANTQSEDNIMRAISKISQQIGTETDPQRKAELIHERESLLRKHHGMKKKE